MNAVRVVTVDNEVRVVTDRVSIALDADKAVDLGAALIKHGIELHRAAVRRNRVVLVEGGIS